MNGLRMILGAVLAIGFVGCSTLSNGYKPEHFSGKPTLALFEALSSDALAGRGVGTEGSAEARSMMIDRLSALGVQPVGDSFEHPFKYGPFRNPQTGEDARPDKDGINVIGRIPGRDGGGPTMVITAHYDHLGVRDGEIYNGADDNASGVVGALAIAEHFAETPPDHDVILVFFDAEEDGFGGARAFIANPPLALESVALNLNFDMVSRGDNGILWASGTYHWPEMIPRLDAVAETAPVIIERGYDEGDGRDDWTLLSDHAVFFRAGIPHIYFGVEDHPDYHRPSDDFENVDLEWFLKSVDTLAMVAEAMDEDLSEIYAMRLAAEAS
ncbi:MAG: M20/M25/M40 family metallo-hydrolase [Pseudomonadota bacterium]